MLRPPRRRSRFSSERPARRVAPFSSLDPRFVGVFIDFVSLVYALIFLPETVDLLLERRKVRRGFGTANPALNGSLA